MKELRSGDKVTVDGKAGKENMTIWIARGYGEFGMVYLPEYAASTEREVNDKIARKSKTFATAERLGWEVVEVELVEKKTNADLTGRQKPEKEDKL